MMVISEGGSYNATARYYSLPYGSKNVPCCFLASLLVSLVTGVIGLYVTNQRRHPHLLATVLVYFAAQLIGAFFFGCLGDVSGRKQGLLLSSLLLCLALLGNGLTLSFGDVFTGAGQHEQQQFDHLKHQLRQLPPIGVEGFGSALTVGLLTTVGGVGAGCGGLFALSGITVAESCRKDERVPLIAAIVCLQGVGPLVVRIAVWIAFALRMESRLGAVIACLIFGCCAISAFLVIITAVLCEETPHFSRNVLGGVEGVNILNPDLRTSLLASSSAATGGTGNEHRAQSPLLLGAGAAAANRPPQSSPTHHLAAQKGTKSSSRFRRYISTVWRHYDAFKIDLLGMALPWMLLDFTFYGDGMSHFLLVQHVEGLSTDAYENLFILVVLAFSLLGYLLAFVIVNRLIPKLAQILGFIILAFVFFGLALCLYSITHASSNPASISQFAGASLLYDCFFRFFNFIPQITTYLIPIDASPTKVRGTFFGLAIAVSRCGALLGLVAFWLLFDRFKSRPVMLLAGSSISLAAAGITRSLAPCVKHPPEDLAVLDVQSLNRLSLRKRTQLRL